MNEFSSEKIFYLEKRILKYLKENLELNYHPDLLKLELDFTKGQESRKLEFLEAMRHLINADLIFNRKDPMGGDRVYINELIQILGVEYLALKQASKLNECNK
ncbi:MAG: hypothetical protein ACTSRI_19405 [Promethearchaeota archaeon]